ncbi:hypothetical protein N0V93_007147 [Gnomoniopsis smithogilvyi]|uniref:Uncharacterized protein n=1 Tax=Gnomoniopsis smithogilvyi TaxID=1191159 RepID=A0A9W9CWC1_9PEZI|nr:hypothetical protein N0V93_007147 [Gnomoniopsis smithogilvyi]
MLPGLATPLRPYQTDPLERLPYAYQRPEDHMQRPVSSYLPQHNQILPQHQHPYLPAPAQIPTSGPVAGYSTVTSRPPTRDSQQSFASPKSQRKTKGHVAAACVPCKKAHLRWLNDHAPDASRTVKKTLVLTFSTRSAVALDCEMTTEERGLTLDSGPTVRMPVSDDLCPISPKAQSHMVTTP